MPEPILVSIAAALAAKSATSLYELVRRRFAGREEAAAALEAADGAPPGSPEVTELASRLAEEETVDPAFARELRGAWQRVVAGQDSVGNQIAGNVSGRVVQARDIKGGISF